MSTYRFLGLSTEIGEIKLTKFGQAIELPDELARQVIGSHESGGAAILPNTEFEELGFTEQELSLYASPISHGQANESFHGKKKKGLLAVHEFRSRASAGDSLELPKPQYKPFVMDDDKSLDDEPKSQQ
jgi:hypothetical protein